MENINLEILSIQTDCWPFIALSKFANASSNAHLNLPSNIHKHLVGCGSKLHRTGDKLH